jgi:NADP-dependent 3-hydroxy acid dehydrogenase YdfG
MPLQNSDVWFITGCSTGFGRELAKLVLDRGYRAVVTARDPSQIQDLTAHHDGRALVVPLDVTDNQQVASAVKQAEAKFGSIDVLVNNAGFGYVGALEESDEAEVRAMMETNFFGLARMTHEVLPSRVSPRLCPRKSLHSASKSCSWSRARSAPIGPDVP